jgi:hypothetical protein
MNLSRISIYSSIYILVTALITNFLPIPEFIKVLLAQPGLLLIPYLFGKPINFIIKHILSIKADNSNLIDSIFNWSTGIIFLILVEIILYINQLFNIKIFIIIILLIGISSVFIPEKINHKKHIKYLIITFFYGLFFAIFITYFWNYPFANENDYITHTFYTIKLITEDRPLIFYSTYFPSTNTLYAVLSIIFNINLEIESLKLLWSSRFLLYPIYAIGIYLFSYSLSKKFIVSLFSAFLSISVLSGYGGFFLPIQAVPLTFVSILYIYIMYSFNSDNLINKSISNITIFYTTIIHTLSFIIFYLTNSNGMIGYEIGYILIILFIVKIISIKFFSIDKRKTHLTLFIMLDALLFIHKFNGFIAGVITIVFLFSIHNLKKHNLKFSKYISSFSLFFLLILIIFLNSEIVSYPSIPIISPPARGYYMYGWNNIINYITKIYPTFLQLTFIIGYIYMILNKENIQLFSALIICSLLLITYFFPIYASYRLLLYAHPFIVIITSFFIFDFVINKKDIKIKYSYPSSKSNKYLHFKIPFPSSREQIMKNKRTTNLLKCILIIMLSLTIYINNIKELNNPVVTINQQDYKIFEIGDYLRKNISKDSIIIANLGGYSWYQGISAQYGQIWPLYLWKNYQYQENITREIYLANSSERCYSIIMDLVKNKEYFISHPDYRKKDVQKFYKEPEEILILYDTVLAKEYGNIDSINKFFDLNYFSVIYSTRNLENETFYIFKVKHITKMKN